MRRILAPGRIVADPFGERTPADWQVRLRLLGASFHFRTDDKPLLQLVKRTFGQLPNHRLGSSTTISLRVLRGADDPNTRWMKPPLPRSISGAGLLCASIDAANFAVVSPTARSGLVALSPRLLRFPYHARYELLEFSVYTLASRVLDLVPLHAACVALNRRGLLLMGDSGAGKTTLAVQCLLGGLDFVSEDSAFVHPRSKLVTGIANYVHLRTDSLGFLPTAQAASWQRHSQIIRRRSGVEKLEVDLRRAGGRLARSACRAQAIVFLSARPAGKGPVLRPLSLREALVRLKRLQAYAAQQPSWHAFTRLAATLEYWELRRGPPGAAVDVLRSLVSA